MAIGNNQRPRDIVIERTRGIGDEIDTAQSNDRFLRRFERGHTHANASSIKAASASSSTVSAASP